jgi:hypothetical protein
MAFGKDESLRRHVDSFRQSTAQSMRTPRRTGRKGPPFFVDMYKCSTTETDLIRLVPGDYPQDQLVGEGENIVLEQVIRPYIKFVEHYDGFMEKGAICSAGPWSSFKEKRTPCYGCDIYWETAQRNSEGRWESTRISRQTKYAFSVYDYGAYHKMDQIDRESGQPKINPKTQKPYTNWVKCLGQGCDACRAGVESKVGNMSHWPINSTQLEVLRSTALDIGKSCQTCRSMDNVQSVGWICTQCGECAIDMTTTELKRDEILKLTDNPVQCGHCSHIGFLEEVIHCAFCAGHGQSAVRAGLFDVDLKVKLVEAGNGKSLQIQGWSQPHPVEEPFAKDVKPVDLLSRYYPDTLEFQAQRFGINTQPAAAPAGQPQRAPQTAGYTAPAAPARQYTVPYSKPQ